MNPISNSLREILEADLQNITSCKIPWEKLSGSKVVVTGAAGFLGGYLVRTLLALQRLGKVPQPVRVVAVVRNIDRAHSRLADVAKDMNIEFLEWDLTQIATPNLGNIDYIFHVASQASPRYYNQDPVGTLLPNTIGTAALFEVLRQSTAPKGLLYISSSEVYGAVTKPTGLNESDYGIVDSMTLRACYAEGKRAGETTCVAYSHQYHIPTWIVRPFHTYGPGLSRGDGRVFADFAFDVLDNKNIVMNSDGSARRAFCYASDAIAGIFTVLLCGAIGQAYNLANAKADMSVMELAELLISLYPEKKLLVERKFDAVTSHYSPSTYTQLIPDTSKLELLGWSASVPPKKGFKLMIEGLKP